MNNLLFIYFSLFLEGQQQILFKMERKISQGRKLSTDMHRKLSAISNCSDVSNLSVMLGMDPNDFKSTIQNILGKYTDNYLHLMRKVDF